MLLNTQRLFTRLLPRMRVSAICDVGSMNGADAATFSAAVPQASIYAFEPNPHNFRLMQAREQFFQGRNISVVPLAATNYDGVADLFVVAAEYSHSDPRRGMSSLHRRRGEWAPQSIEPVETTRLDSFLDARCPRDARLAVWIDAEGTAYEVIEGLGARAEQVQLVHVEVETAPCIGANQKLYPQVKALLQRLGFTELGTDQPVSELQFNALFVKAALPRRLGLQVRASLAVVYLRSSLVRAACRLCPACVRRYASLRRRSSS
jgi:FkbM family methyltransferase